MFYYSLECLGLSSIRTEREIFYEYIENYLLALKNNGQILDSYILSISNFSKNRPIANLLAPLKDSLNVNKNNVHGMLWKNTLEKEFNIKLKFKFLGKHHLGIFFQTPSEHPLHFF